MALSNLLNEPRREITEQVIGAIGICGFIGIDYVIAIWGVGAKATLDVITSMLFIPPVLGLAFVTLFFGVHLIGEIFCDLLKQVGADPRPKQRF